LAGLSVMQLLQNDSQVFIMFFLVFHTQGYRQSGKQHLHGLVKYLTYISESVWSRGNPEWEAIETISAIRIYECRQEC